MHRIAEESGSQSIYVANSENSSEAKHILNLYLNDQLGTSSAFVEEKLLPINVNLRGLFLESPITICIIGLTLLLAIVTSWEPTYQFIRCYFIRLLTLVACWQV